MPVLDTLHILLWSMNVSKIKDPATDYQTMVYSEKNDWAVDFRLPDFSSFAVRVVPSGAERYTRHRMMPGRCSRFGAWGLALTECIHGWPKGNQGGWSFKSGSQKTWGCLHNHSYSKKNMCIQHLQWDFPLNKITPPTLWVELIRCRLRLFVKHCGSKTNGYHV